MFYEVALAFESFVAFTALERPFLCVCPHVTLKMARCDTAVVAVVTFKWLFSCMFPHNMLFHICSADHLAAHLAFGSIHPMVDSFVILQVH